MKRILKHFLFRPIDKNQKHLLMHLMLKGTVHDSTNAILFISI
jgi:hypothetical protein